MRTRHMTGCRAWRKRLLTHLDGELPALEQILFEHHLEECPACEQAVAFHLSIEQALHQSAGAEPDSLFEDRMVAGVHARLDAHAAREAREKLPTPMRSSRSRLFRTMAAAAVILVLARPLAPPTNETQQSPGLLTATGSPDRFASLTVLDADRVIPTRLSAARKTVHEALRSARNADDFRSEFRRRTAELSRKNWPLEELVIAAIDHADPELANSAIRGVAKLSFAAALPAVERASFRAPTAREALMTLGTLAGERYLPRLERSLARPERRAAAAAGLARSGSARAARVLSQAALRPDQEQTALEALLSMGTPGVGELLRLQHAGFLPAADLLQNAGLPTHAQILELLRDCDDPDLLLAAMPAAVDCGEPALGALMRLISMDRLREPALAATMGIGGERALTLLLGVPDLTPGARLDVERAIRRLLRADRHGDNLAGRLARGPEGQRLLDALLPAGLEMRPHLTAIFEDHLASPDYRAGAAEWLAGREAADPMPLLDAVLEVALQSETAAARLLCSAARAGAREADFARLNPISKHTSKRLLKRAEVIATRWAGDGLAPHPWELRQLSRMLADTLPKL